jgi:hypothetical protein
VIALVALRPGPEPAAPSSNGARPLANGISREAVPRRARAIATTAIAVISAEAGRRQGADIAQWRMARDPISAEFRPELSGPNKKGRSSVSRFTTGAREVMFSAGEDRCPDRTPWPRDQFPAGRVRSMLRPLVAPPHRSAEANAAAARRVSRPAEQPQGGCRHDRLRNRSILELSVRRKSRPAPSLRRATLRVGEC